MAGWRRRRRELKWDLGGVETLAEKSTMTRRKLEERIASLEETVAQLVAVAGPGEAERGLAEHGWHVRR